uniref:DUF1618 domain-containing protein n=1 Tax=Arundo donax TaxID=35708 RepID=A0A0A9H463_ARUDO
MARPWVLLNRIVHFEDLGVALTGGLSSGGGEGFDGGASEGAAAIGGSSKMLSPREAMVAMKPCPVIASPPEVTRLSMLLQTPAARLGQCVRIGEISSTDKSILAIYSGLYRPGNGGYSGDGGYLVFDASSNALSAIPALPHSPNLKGLGRSAVVLRHGSAAGGYTLAELVTTCDTGLPEAELCVWSPSSTVSPDGEWIQTSIRLPLPEDLCGPTYFFKIDMAFSFAGCFCWVDLLTGVLVCDPSAQQGPKFSFIPLPVGYCMYVKYSRRLRLTPEVFRSMSCVRGAIKFVALVGYTEEACPSNEVMLKTWTLSPDFKEWNKGKDLSVGEVWASDSFNKMELPRVVPMCPVLSMHEDEIIYAILNDMEEVDEVDEYEDIVGVTTVPKAHYKIRLDMLQNKVMSSTKSSTCSFEWLTPKLLASEFNAYLQDPKVHQGMEEASNVGVSAKRIKY